MPAFFVSLARGTTCLDLQRLGLLLLLLALPVIAEAQPTSGRTVVLSVGSAGSSDPRAADHVEAALIARGVAVVSMHDARDRMQAISRAPASPDTSDLDVLATEAHAALEHVAFGRSAAAKRSVQEVFKRAERALESLNRETKTARNVLDACLALVRSALARGDRDDALAEAMRCRRLVPDVSPSEFLHPANVTGVLAEADDQLRRTRMGRLSVESVPENGCAVYVNGRHLGVTPFRLDRAAAGEYRVQVECSRTPGRVHVAQLGDVPVSLLVDSELDRALHSEARITLSYDDAQLAKRLSPRHGIDVVRSIRADEGILVQPIGDNIELTRVSLSQGAVIGRARMPSTANSKDAPAALDHALDALLEGRLEEERVESPQPSGPLVAAVSPSATTLQTAPVPVPSASVADRPGQRTRRVRIAGGVIAASGVALLLAGGAFEHQHQVANDALYRLDLAAPDLAAQSEAIQHDYDRGARLRRLGLAGGALLTAAVPMARIDVTGGVPWWSYAVGAAGAGLAGWGLAELVQDGDCEARLLDDSCARKRDSAGKGMVLLSAAAPLLAVPMDHLLEWLLTRRAKGANVALSLSPTGAMLALRKVLP